MKNLLSKLVIVALVGVLTNCSKDADQVCLTAVPQATIDAVDQTQLAKDVAIITSYLTANSITARTDATSGVRYVIKVTGTGAIPCLQSTVSVQYSGRVLSQGGTLGAVFDSSATPVNFSLQNLILGWQIGFLDLPKGTTATLYIPSGYGYGVAGSSPKIPSNAVLVFEIQLLDFVNTI